MHSTLQLSLFGVEKKWCSVCRDWLQVNCFSPRAGSPGKTIGRCRPCQAEYMREYARMHRERVRENYRRWAENHPETIAAWGRRYRTAHAEKHNAAVLKCKQEHKEQYAEYGRQYAASHPEQRRATVRRSRRRHRVKYQAHRRQWGKQNLALLTERQRPVNQRRRARKRGNGGSFTVWEWEAIKARANWTCLCCGNREPDITLHADHVVPLVLGGFNFAANLQPLCRRCNAVKGSKFIDYRS